jgi:peptidoglycan/LPS O-acetylase OafA/YrhL
MNKEKGTKEIFEKKKHFEILDGLRGVAALAIVIFHFMEWVYPDYKKSFIGHGFLAVDFFFCLSGFVIAYAYDDRIRKIGVIEFFKSRFIRLHPLVVLGSVLGLVCFIFDPFALPTTHSFGYLALLFVSSLLLIPLPVMEERFFNLFALNAPAWSLFWEYFANIFYALVLYKTGRRSLIVFLMFAATGICLVGYQSGNLLGGWGKDNFLDGGVRVSYSFLAGIFVYRSNWIMNNRLGFIGMAILLLLAFTMPSSSWNWLTQSLVVLVYFPLIVSMGAGSTLTKHWKKLCQFSGNISYPLYMTHYAGIWIFGNYFSSKKPSGFELILVIISGTILMVAIAWCVMVVYDIPVRKYLNKKRAINVKRFQPD